MDIKEILQKLLSSPKMALSETILSLLPNKCEVTKTPLGTILVRFSGEEETPILLDAHMDTIGFVVTAVTSQGFLKVASCGGIDSRVLAGSEVTVWGSEPLFGIFTTMPPHLKKSPATSAVAVEEQAIDLGFSAQQVSSKVKVGDLVTFRSSFTTLCNNRFSSSGLDNLCGVASLIFLAYKLVEMNLPNTVILQFSNFEETGHRFAGAVTGAFSVAPKEAVVIDASFAKVPGLNYQTPGEMNMGVMIGFSPMLNGDISGGLRKLAQENKISYTQEILGGSSGTNADGIVSSGGGVPTGLLSYPLLNMHTPVEVVSQNDLNALVDLLVIYCRNGGLANGK